MKNIAILICIFIVGYAVGRFTTPAKIVEKKIEDKKENEKIVEKIVKDVIYITKEVKSPDGTVTTETTMVDKSILDKSIDKVIETRIEASRETINKKQEFLVAALIAFKDFELKPSYGISIDKQFIGPITLGAYYILPADFGVRLGSMF